MGAKLAKELPALIIDLGVGVVGFVIALGWWKASGRELDRDAVVLLAKIWGGIALFGIVLAFIM